MRANKTATAVFIVGCLIFSVQAQCVVITPSNVVLPVSAGGIFSFDFVVLDATDINATSFKATMNVSGPSTLTFDKTSSEAVTNEFGYWVYGNSGGVIIKEEAGGKYSFEDDPLSGFPEPLAADDIMARYAFVWDGTEGDYTFVLNLETLNSFVQDEYYIKEPLGFTPGLYPGTYNNFTVNIPEPDTLIIFAFGFSVVLLKRRGT